VPLCELAGGGAEDVAALPRSVVQVHDNVGECGDVNWLFSAGSSMRHGLTAPVLAGPHARAFAKPIGFPAECLDY